MPPLDPLPLDPLPLRLPLPVLLDPLIPDSPELPLPDREPLPDCDDPDEPPWLSLFRSFAIRPPALPGALINDSTCAEQCLRCRIILATFAPFSALVMRDASESFSFFLFFFADGFFLWDPLRIRVEARRLQNVNADKLHSHPHFNAKEFSYRHPRACGGSRSPPHRP